VARCGVGPEVITTRASHWTGCRTYVRTKLDLQKLADEATRLSSGKGDNTAAVRQVFMDRFPQDPAERATPLSASDLDP